MVWHGFVCIFGLLLLIFINNLYIVQVLLRCGLPFLCTGKNFNIFRKNCQTMQSSNSLLCLLLVAAAVTLNTLSVSGLEPLVMDPVGYSFKHPDSPKSKVIIVEDGTNPTVSIPVLGDAKGRTLQTLFGRNFSAFHSIPYAPQPERFMVVN